MHKSTLLHLRIPFSFFLLPVFLFALSLSGQTSWLTILIVFVSLHLFLYPASNAYNSYFDKDEDSIGGLKNPPKVTRQLFWVALVFDAIAILLALILSWQLALMQLIYGMVSKAYSHPSVRLKRMAITGWLTAGVFQGYFTFLMCYLGLNSLGFSDLWIWQVQFPAILSTMLLLGSYPMTQIYQHEEDGKRGDETISRKLGILGTFHFTAIMFLISCVGFFLFYWDHSGISLAIVFQASLMPILLYFAYWYLKVRGDQQLANFRNTMNLNFLSSLVLNVFFLATVFL